MARAIRMFDGGFGRLQLVETEGGEASQPVVAPQVVIKQEPTGLDVRVDGGHAQLLVFQAATDWLRGRFPAVFAGGSQPFASACEPVNPRIRQLADTLVVEVLNDQFLSHDRLEVML